MLMVIIGCSTSGKSTSKMAEVVPREEYHEKEIAISELTLGTGDEIDISVWRNSDLDGTYKVDSFGNIFIPLAGVIEVKDVSAFEMRDRVVEALSRYLVKPQVIVTVTAYRSRKVYVLGEVKRPGIYHMSESMATLVEAIAKTGGFTEDANSKKVFLIKGGLENDNVQVFNMKALLKKGDVSQNPPLSSGDIVYVPSSFIANVDRFFEHLSTIINPIVELERGILLEPHVEDVLSGEKPITVIVTR